MKTNQEVISRLRQFTSYNCNNLLDAKLCEDIRYVCDEVERFSKEIVKANNHMDEDHITIQRYKNKLSKYEYDTSIFKSNLKYEIKYPSAYFFS